MLSWWEVALAVFRVPPCWRNSMATRWQSLSQLGDRVVRANQAVVSNLSVWDLFGGDVLDKSQLDPSYLQQKMDTPVGKSFMHLHVGFKATQEELNQLQAHNMFIDDLKRGVEAEDNAILLSIPLVHDATVAPEGYAVLHIYTPSTEGYTRWKGVNHKSSEYKELKDEQSQYLWRVLEKIIPDIRVRTVVSRVGTPLTHQRFLNRHRGSYGPTIQAGE